MREIISWYPRGRAEISTPALEAHGKFNAASAVGVARMLEPFDLLLEEPVPAEHTDAMAGCSARRRSRRLGRAAVTTHHPYPRRSEQRRDVSFSPTRPARGITPMKKISTLAETYDAGFAPHNPNGPVVH